MINWKKAEIDDEVIYMWDEFDGKGCLRGRVSEIYIDHIIVIVDDMKLWCDDDSACMFLENK